MASARCLDWLGSRLWLKGSRSLFKGACSSFFLVSTIRKIIRTVYWTHATAGTISPCRCSLKINFKLLMPELRTTMLNRDIYNKAPQENRLVNNGVAEVSEDHSEAALAVLRYELETFVCDGQYERGLEVILDKFLLNLDSKAEQPGVWISGFYGSGKSHLAKMLRTLWTDYQFADGASARSLVKLPTSVFERLRELT